MVKRTTAKSKAAARRYVGRLIQRAAERRERARMAAEDTRRKTGLTAAQLAKVLKAVREASKSGQPKAARGRRYSYKGRSVYVGKGRYRRRRYRRRYRGRGMYSPYVITSHCWQPQGPVY